MKVVRKELDSKVGDQQKAVTPQDQTNYLWLSAFIMSFHRVRQKKRVIAYKKQVKEQKAGIKAYKAKLKSNKVAAEQRARDAEASGDAAETLAAQMDLQDNKEAESQAMPAELTTTIPVVFFDAEPVFATVDFPAFKFLMSRVEHYMDNTPKEWEAVAACMDMYTQVVRTIYEMSLFGDDQNKRDADVLRRNVFYDRNNVDLLVHVLKEYRPYRNNRRSLFSSSIIHSLTIMDDPDV
jgi:hypothetical protein